MLGKKLPDVLVWPGHGRGQRKRHGWFPVSEFDSAVLLGACVGFPRQTGLEWLAQARSRDGGVGGLFNPEQVNIHQNRSNPRSPTHTKPTQVPRPPHSCLRVPDFHQPIPTPIPVRNQYPSNLINKSPRSF